MENHLKSRMGVFGQYQRAWPTGLSDFAGLLLIEHHFKAEWSDLAIEAERQFGHSSLSVWKWRK